MEQHKSLQDHHKYLPVHHLGLHTYYVQAKAFTLEFYKDTYDRILNTKLSEVSKERFFREYVWSVHTSGFSAKAVSSFWERLIEAYGRLNEMGDLGSVMSRVSPVVNNPAKIKAVHKTATELMQAEHQFGWETYRDNNIKTPGDLTRFGFIGPITKFHLARNIGMTDFVKPDLHLERMAKYWGYESCLEMCKDCPDDAPLGLRDFVLWMAASTFGTKKMKLGPNV